MEVGIVQEELFLGSGNNIMTSQLLNGISITELANIFGTTEAL
jgi:hypothetical protein